MSPKEQPTLPFKPTKPTTSASKPATSPLQPGPSTAPLPSPLFVSPHTPKTASQQPTYETSAEKAKRLKGEKEEAKKHEIGKKETQLERVKRENEERRARKEAERRAQRKEEEEERLTREAGNLHPGTGEEVEDPVAMGERPAKRKPEDEDESGSHEPPLQKTKTHGGKGKPRKSTGTQASEESEEDEPRAKPKAKKPTRKQPGRIAKSEPAEKTTDSDSEAAPSSPESSEHSVYNSEREKSDKENMSESEQSEDETKLTSEDDDSEVKEMLRPRSPVRPGRRNPPRGARGIDLLLRIVSLRRKRRRMSPRVRSYRRQGRGSDSVTGRTRRVCLRRKRTVIGVMHKPDKKGNGKRGNK